MVKKCGDGRRRLADGFTIDVETVAGNADVTAQSVADAADGASDGQDGFTVTEVGAVEEVYSATCESKKARPRGCERRE